jgi:hypothetical protein
VSRLDHSALVEEALDFVSGDTIENFTSILGDIAREEVFEPYTEEEIKAAWDAAEKKNRILRPDEMDGLLERARQELARFPRMSDVSLLDDVLLPTIRGREAKDTSLRKQVLVVIAKAKAKDGKSFPRIPPGFPSYCIYSDRSVTSRLGKPVKMWRSGRGQEVYQLFNEAKEMKKISVQRLMTAVGFTAGKVEPDYWRKKPAKPTP